MYEANGTLVIGRESLTRKDYCLLVGHKKMHVPRAASIAHLYTLLSSFVAYGMLVTRC